MTRSSCLEQHAHGTLLLDEESRRCGGVVEFITRILLWQQLLVVVQPCHMKVPTLEDPAESDKKRRKSKKSVDSAGTREEPHEPTNAPTTEHRFDRAAGLSRESRKSLCCSELTRLRIADTIVPSRARSSAEKRQASSRARASGQSPSRASLVVLRKQQCLSKTYGRRGGGPTRPGKVPHLVCVSLLEFGVHRKARRSDNILGKPMRHNLNARRFSAQHRRYLRATGCRLVAVDPLAHVLANMIAEQFHATDSKEAISRRSQCHPAFSYEIGKLRVTEDAADEFGFGVRESPLPQTQTPQKREKK